MRPQLWRALALGSVIASVSSCAIDSRNLSVIGEGDGGTGDGDGDGDVGTGGTASGGSNSGDTGGSDSGETGGSSSGGTDSSGGDAATGGSDASGGDNGTGGSNPVEPFAVNDVRTRGTWTGSVYALSDGVNPMPEITYSGPDACMTGSITSGYEYFVSLNWEINDGLDALPGGSGVRITLTEPSTLMTRLGIETTMGERWCLDLPTGTTSYEADWADFATECWNDEGTPYAGSAISAVYFVIPGTTGTLPFEFCVSDISRID